MILDLLEFFETREIGRRADGGHDKRLAHRRLAERLKGHAVAGLIESLEIINNLTPRGEFPIVAGSKSEDVPRRGKLGLGGDGNR